MIVRPRPGLLQLFFVVRGSLVRKIWPQILAVTFISALIVAAHHLWPQVLPFYNSSGPFTLLGITLSIFLSFRNNACYERWWEARRQWGDLIYCTRNVARQTIIMNGTEEGRRLRARILTLTIAHTQSLVPHLRAGSENKALPLMDEALLARYRKSVNPPTPILEAIGETMEQARQKGILSDIGFQMIDRTFSDIAHVQAACERIRHTPVPFGYTLLLHRTAYLFCFLMPFGFADLLSWSTPLASALVAYTFFALDALGDELEEPFGLGENDLPVAAMADTACLSLREALGETDLPGLPQPVDYLLH